MKINWNFTDITAKQTPKDNANYLNEQTASQTYSNSIQPSPNCIDIFLNCFRVCLAIKSWNFCFAAYCVMILNDSKKTFLYKSVVERMSTTKNNCLHLFPWYKKRPLQNYDCFNGFNEKKCVSKKADAMLRQWKQIYVFINISHKFQVDYGPSWLEKVTFWCNEIKLNTLFIL